MSKQQSSGMEMGSGIIAKTSILLDSASMNALALVVQRIGKAGFDRRLLTWLGKLVSFDSALVLLYAEQQRPKILVDALDNPDRRNNAQHYIDGAYLLDPFYLHACRSDENCLIQLHDIVPEDFSTSDYVRTYYRRSAIKDEINFLIPVDQATYALSVERSVRRASFSPEDLSKLRQVLALVSALIKRHWRQIADQHERDQPDSEHLRFERILANFGHDVLTPREREVVGLILRGYALAQVAERLKISLETARVHRRNLYEKLGISSLAELFSRALAELAARR